MASSCQCRVRDAIGEDAGAGASGSRSGPGLLEGFQAGAADPDWRVREFFAGQLAGAMRRDPVGRGRWEPLVRALLDDPVPAVRMAAAFQLRTLMVQRQMRSWRPGGDPFRFADQLAQDREEMATLPRAAELDAWIADHLHSLQDMDRSGGPPADIADRELTSRRWAAHNHAAAASLLVEDPVCEVRADAVGQALARGSDSELAARARQDPCPRVRAAAIRALGEQEMADPLRGRLTQGELLAVAAVTDDAERLSELATHPDDKIRAAVAANPACPGPLLTELYRDPVWDVWTAAKGNPAWPDGVWIADALADHGLEQPLDAFRLATAVLGTRTPVRCAEGRSAVYIGAGYMRPHPDAPWLCDRDAVVLHSWGPFCWEHQLEADECRQSGGSDGYLAQRLRSGLWVHLGQGGPTGPLAELWAGPW